MSRYTTAVGAEAEYEPGSGKRVLWNLLGITSKVEMDTVESESLIGVQHAYSTRPGLESQRITADFICGMHRDWLGGIYPWAGSYRTVDMTKDGFTWPSAYLVTENMNRFETGILTVHTPCMASPDYS